MTNLKSSLATQNAAAPSVSGNPLCISEYTSWTALSDLSQRKFYLRTYASLNYVDFDLTQLKTLKKQNHI